ncbi:MAG TPA: hypothetical protein VJ482_04950 [Acidimicrobiia bacterium]|nr:hypothetical protein [Acidimicrobiia bacterium]
MDVALVIAGVIAGLAVLMYGGHRFLLYAEQRGWVYYKHRRAPAGAGSAAFMELMKIYRPEIEHVIEEERGGDLRVTDDETGQERDLGRIESDVEED